MFRKNARKIITSLLVFGLVFALQATNSYPEIKGATDLKELNRQNNLVSVTKIGDQKFNSALSQNLKASIFGLFGNQKENQEILVQLDTEKESADIYLLELRSKKDPKDLARQYQKLSSVYIAEPNTTIELGQYGFPVKLKQKPKATTDSGKVGDTIVAIIDSGIDADHPVFENKLVEGYDFTKQTKKLSDELGHGTHIAGIIAQEAEQAKIMPLRFTEGKEGKISDLLSALKFAGENNVDIINLSMSTPNQSNIMLEAIQDLDEQGITIVSAAGNYNTELEFYPAAWPEVISVGALTEKGDKLFGSNYGSWVDFSAPGLNIYSAFPDDTFSTLSGTSQSTAKVSAQIANAILKNSSSDLTQQEIINILVRQSKEANDDFDMGYRIY